eukprot:2881945-Pyramimonas_sp.AAC.1
MSMTTSCRARCIGEVHGDVRMRGVGAQELVQALLRMPRVEAVLGGQPFEGVERWGGAWSRERYAS